MAINLALPDYIAIQSLAFDWAESYDTKDWTLLRQCLAPSVDYDFRGIQGLLHEKISPDDFVGLLQKTIGDKRLQTQHHVGASKVECLNDGSVKVQYQLRVAHQRYESADLSSAIVNKGHGHGVVTHWYTKVGGVWKISGVTPRLYWSEYDLFGTLASPGNVV